MAVIQPRSTYILYQCAKCGDDRTSFNVICDVCNCNELGVMGSGVNLTQNMNRHYPMNV